MPRAHLGIDFGTSHTVAVLRRADGRTEALTFDGTPLLPSAVFANADGTLSTGRDAVHASRTDPAAYEPYPKRRIDDTTVLLAGRDVAVVDMFAAILSRVRERCAEVNRAAPDAVTLTHPAVWGPTRRNVLRTAAAKAGFPQVRLLPEPVAAAAYYARELRRDLPVGACVVVHDFGGGTFDASVVRRTREGFEVLSVDGLDDLGGVDVDEAVIDHLRRRYPDPAGWVRLMDPFNATDRRHRRMFREDVRAAKEILSRHSNADLHVPVLDLDVHLTRDELEAVATPLLARAVDVTRAVIEDARLSMGDVAGVFLVGGGSRMPMVGTLLHRGLGRAPAITDDIEQVVAHGAILDGADDPATEGEGNETHQTLADALARLRDKREREEAARTGSAKAEPEPEAERAEKAENAGTATAPPASARRGLVPLAVFTFILLGEIVAGALTEDSVPARIREYTVTPMIAVFVLTVIFTGVRRPATRVLLQWGQALYTFGQVAIGVYAASVTADTWPLLQRIPFMLAGAVAMELLESGPVRTWFRAKNSAGAHWLVRLVLVMAVWIAIGTAPLAAFAPSIGDGGPGGASSGFETYRVDGAPVNLAASPSGTLVSLGADNRVEEWNTGDGTRMASLDLGAGQASGLAVAELGGDTIVGVRLNGSVRTYRMRNGEEQCAFEGSAPVEAFTFGEVGDEAVAIAAYGGSYGVWSLDGCGKRGTYPNKAAGAVRKVMYSNASGADMVYAVDVKGVPAPLDLGTGKTANFNGTFNYNDVTVTRDGVMIALVTSTLVPIDPGTGVPDYRAVSAGFVMLENPTDMPITAATVNGHVLVAVVDKRDENGDAKVHVCDLTTQTEVTAQPITRPEKGAVPLAFGTAHDAPALFVGVNGTVTVLPFQEPSN